MLFGYVECKSNKHRPEAQTHVPINSHVLSYK